MRVAATILLLCVVGCASDGGSPREPAPTPAGTERFDWGGQPIAFAVPDASWRRDREQSGGLRGVRFIKSGSVGEEIRVAEHYALDDRDRCSRLEELLDELENLSRGEMQHATRHARLWASPPIHSREERDVELANAELDRALASFRADDLEAAREAIGEALQHAVGIRYTLDEVLDRVLFTRAQYDAFGKVEVEPPVEGSIAGEPSVSVDFTLDSRDRDVLFHGRQHYVLKNNRLFVLAFIGLPENLPLFEAIVESVDFPAGSCAH